MAKNPHAQALGRMAKGKRKNYSPEERAKRREHIKKIRIEYLKKVQTELQTAVNDTMQKLTEGNKDQ
jgi:hypothetical protein